MKNQTYTKFSFFLTVAMIALFVTASVAFAQDGASVYLQPQDSGEGTITVAVIADNVTDLYGAEFQLRYDPAMLAVQDAKPDQEGIQIEAGPLLPASKGFVVANKVDAVEGTVTFALTLLNPAPPVTGGGPLAHVTFNVLSDGPSTIDVERAKLVAIDLQTIPSTTAPLAVDGQQKATQQNAEQSAPQSESQVETQPAAQPESQGVDQTSNTVAPANSQATTQDTPNSSQFPWWIVAAGIMIFGFLGLVAFVIVSGLLKPQQEKSPKQTQSHKAQAQQSQPSQPTPQNSSQPVNQTARTRPSAFK